MILRYILADGAAREVELGSQPINLGRAGDADIQINDKLVSRTHCGITFWDNAYFLRDFKSRNGTFVNGQKIALTQLHPGDHIRIGNTTLILANRPRKGTDTVIQEVKDEMAKGKGYHTILQEIIKDENKS